MNAPVSHIALETVEIDTSDDPLWYRDAVIYQLNVKAFFDSNNDGMGDFQGVTAKLDYVKDLGVNTIWLMPFYPSPLRDDGYDIAEYEDVHPQYGTLADFREMMAEAHKRGLRVITELVINHTSSEHPWFKAARLAPPGSPERNFYVWSDTDQIYQGTRIIFTDTETSNWTWDPVAKQYYWHRFFSHQPDLNFDNPAVMEAILKTMRFWLDMGVDGFRLDAIPYLVERDGTSNENLPETHAVIKRLRAAIDAQYKNRFLLAEANMWPEDVREYFGDGDECHMAYHFPLMPRMYMAIAQEDRHPIVEIMAQTPDIPEGCQWAIFLRNHDELTLEMVTSKERDYMYTMYAADTRARINLGIRRRLAPLMENDLDRVKLMKGMLLSMPGSPIIYYGDEIGMGDNVFVGDRNGVRTPMQWSPDRNAGFSRADPQRLYLQPIMDAMYGYEALNVETQARDASSLLNWTKRMLAVRKTSHAFGRGKRRFPETGQPQDPGLPQRARGRRDPGRVQPVARRAAGGARPVGVQGPCAHRDAGPRAVPAHRRAAVPAHAVVVRLLLVQAHGRGRCAQLARPGRGPAGLAHAGAVRRLDQLLPRARDAVAHRHGRAHAQPVRARHAAAPHRDPALVRLQGRAHCPCAHGRPRRVGGQRPELDAALAGARRPAWRRHLLHAAGTGLGRARRRAHGRRGAGRARQGAPAGAGRPDGRRLLRRGLLPRAGARHFARGRAGHGQRQAGVQADGRVRAAEHRHRRIAGRPPQRHQQQHGRDARRNPVPQGLPACAPGHQPRAGDGPLPHRGGSTPTACRCWAPSNTSPTTAAP
jgi:trehalose synthase